MENDNDSILIHKGFPNPAASKLASPLSLDLNQLLIKNPSSTFIFRVSGHSYSDQGIYDGDLIIVDRALSTVGLSDLMIIWQGDSFRLTRHFKEDLDATDWGIVRSVIHSLR
jgi:DNA polymerase V